MRNSTVAAIMATLLVTGLVAPIALADDNEFEDEELILNLVPGASIDDVNARWGTVTLEAFPAGNLYLVDTQGATLVEDLADEMENTDPDVLEAEANYIEETPESVRQMVVAVVGGTFTDFEDQHIAERIGVAAANEVSTGQGVVVAVLDTGIDVAHEVFAGRLLPGYDFIDNDADPSEEANGIDDDGDGSIDGGFGHGTMVAGIISLVAPDAQILPVRALDDEGRSNAWLLAVATRFAVNQGADVINMSFGVPVEIDALRHQIDHADNQNVIIVAAAGNESRMEPAFHPAIDNKSFMVVAVDSTDVKAAFSDWHVDVSVSAPGTGVRSAYPGGWGLGNGCSFAAPFVTGEVALIRQLQPTILREVVEDVVLAAVEPIDHLLGNAMFGGKLGTGRVYLPLAVGSTVSVPDAILLDDFHVAPNPSRGFVTFGGSLAVDLAASISIFDVSGRLVVTLDEGRRAWNGRTARGRLVAPGTYFARLNTPTPATRSLRVLP